MWVLDIETDGIYPTEIKCAVITKFPEEVSTVVLDGAHLYACLTGLGFKAGDKIITFNGSGFDLPVIKHLWKFDLVQYFKYHDLTHTDCYLIGKMIQPDRPKHSLQSWAEEARVPGKFDVDFDKVELSELVDYCIQDTKVTYAVYRHMLKRTPKAGKWKHALQVEQRVAELVADQCFKGVVFDVSKAEDLAKEIAARMRMIEEELAPVMPILPVPDNDQPKLPEKQFRKDGTVSSHMEGYARKFGGMVVDFEGKLVLRYKEELKGPFAGVFVTCTAEMPLKEPLCLKHRLTLSNQIQLKEWLLSQGWSPKFWNSKRVEGKEVRTSPRLTHPTTKEPCPNLVKIPGFEDAGKIADWLMLRARLSLLGDTSKGLIGLATTHHGKIPSEADTLGTPTARFRHRGLVNIPRVTTPYGKEFRSLFRARPGKVWVGWDAAALEACMEAHYTFPFDGGEYARVLMEGDSKLGTDVHTLNMKKLRLPNRDVAKTFKYAITYGAKARKLAASCHATVEVAQRWYDEFWKANPALKEFMNTLQVEWELLDKKYLMGLDGRLLSTRMPHAMLNTKLQGAGAIVMKHAMIIADRKIRNEFPAEVAYGLIRYHDEEQWEADPDVADAVGQIGVDSIRLAGEYLKLNVPLTGEYKVGGNWCETH